MKNRLDEIIVMAKKALVVTDAEIINMKAYDVDKEKRTFVSIGGVFDSIILLAQDILRDPSLHEPILDNMDHPDRHNIAGSMNRPDRASEYENEQ